MEYRYIFTLSLKTIVKYLYIGCQTFECPNRYSTCKFHKGGPKIRTLVVRRAPTGNHNDLKNRKIVQYLPQRSCIFGVTSLKMMSLRVTSLLYSKVLKLVTLKLVIFKLATPKMQALSSILF